MTGPWPPDSFSATTFAGLEHTRGEGWFTVWIASSSVRCPPRDANICDLWMTYRQAGRLTDASRPSFCASEHLTDKARWQITKVLAAENTHNHAGTCPGDARCHIYTPWSSTNSQYRQQPLYKKLEGIKPYTYLSQTDTLSKETLGAWTGEGVDISFHFIGNCGKFRKTELFWLKYSRPCFEQLLNFPMEIDS